MIPMSEMEPEISERLSPFEKLISSDKLTFIPNLYYQQYRLLDSLNEIRADYPQQKILLRKQQTRYDIVLSHVRQTQFILQEEVKYRKATCFMLAKSAKDQFTKRRLKFEQRQLFQRLVYSQLAQNIKAKFDQQKSQAKKIQEKAESNHLKEQKKIKKDISDDIFMDRQQEFSDNMMNEGEDLLGDLFGSNKVEQVIPEKQVIPLNTIETYIKKLNQRQIQQSSEEKCKKQINRKNFLKRINQNLRKRIKSKSEDSNQKNLNSATVCITSLMNNQTQSQSLAQEGLLIEVTNENEYLINTMDSRSKKKKDETFQLKWQSEELQRFNERNSKFEIQKSKFDSNYLTLNMINQEKQYQKIFAKNIEGKQPFPPSLNHIPHLSKLFQQPKYYNTSVDPEYQNFIRQYNKKKVFNKFKQIANITLNNNSSLENFPSNIAKIFLNHDEELSQRIIYKVNNNKIVSVNSLYQKYNLTKNQILLLSFLVRRYLCIFGSNWKIITTLILTHPNFSSMFLNTEQIQQIFQIVKDKDGCSQIQQINMMNKKILPSTLFINSSFEEMKPGMKLQPFAQEMTDQNSQNNNNKQQYEDHLDLSNYEDLINQPLDEHEDPPQYAFIKTAKMFDQFNKNVQLPPVYQSHHTYFTEGLDEILQQFQPRREIRHLNQELKQPNKFSQCSDWVLEKVKNQIKFNLPIRKRKNISDKSSELVRILHTLKQRVQVPRAAIPPPQTKVIAPSSLSINPPASLQVKAPQPPASQPIQTATVPEKKTLPKPVKTGQKAVTKQPKQKKPKKDEKDQEKQGQSK